MSLVGHCECHCEVIVNVIMNVFMNVIVNVIMNVIMNVILEVVVEVVERTNLTVGNFRRHIAHHTCASLYREYETHKTKHMCVNANSVNV